MYFFCGGAHNEYDFWSNFDLHFGLYVDSQTLRTRLQHREPERWSDGSTELKTQLKWNEEFKDNCKKLGTVIIDSSVSPDIIADTILSNI